MSTATTRRVHSTWNATIRTTLGATAAICLVLLAFLWPTRTSTVKDLPIDLVGQPAAIATARTALEKTGAFDIRTATTRDDAVRNIRQRDTYGAVVLTGTTPEVLTASAASPVASQLLTGVAQKMGAQAAAAKGAATAATAQKNAQAAAQAGARAAAAQASAKTLQGVLATTPAGPARDALAQRTTAALAQAAQDQAAAQKAAATAKASVPTTSTAAPVTVTDVVPLSKDDPRGGGLGVAALPLAMGGMIGGVMISTLVVGSRRRLAATAAYGVLAGAGLTLILGPWLDILPGHFLEVWGVITAALLGTAATIVGLNALLGKIGIPLGAIITMFVGNPLSSAGAPQEFLPWHWGTVGQLFVPGASSTLLRQAAYFPDADMTRQWLVLLAWIVLGLVCMAIGRYRDQEVVHIDGATEPEGA